MHNQISHKILVLPRSWRNPTLSTSTVGQAVEGLRLVGAPYRLRTDGREDSR